MNHLYDEKDGKIYFHGAKEGHKTDALKACDKVSYCVYDKGYRREGEWSLNIRSVVVFGKISFVTDAEKTKEICMSLCAKFSDDKAYAVDEFEKAGKAVLCLELTPEHISGKMVNES
jgi:hypothetical protein